MDILQMKRRRTLSIIQFMNGWTNEYIQFSAPVILLRLVVSTYKDIWRNLKAFCGVFYNWIRTSFPKGNLIEWEDDLDLSIPHRRLLLRKLDNWNLFINTNVENYFLFSNLCD